MKSISRFLVAAVALAPLTASAAPITIDFTVTATGSTLAPGTSYAGFAPGTMGSGYFTFDDSIGTAMDLFNGLPTLDLSFNWLGHSYTEADARIHSTSFDSNGALWYWGFGPTAPTFENCGLNCYSYPGPTDFWVTGLSSSWTVDTNSHFHIAGYDGAMNGLVSWSIRTSVPETPVPPVPETSVPEPGTLGLLGLGLMGIGVVRRKRTA
jgi:hypothetical protein